MAYRDTALLYAPMRSLVAEALRAGHLPLWNPYEGIGKPLFAEGIHGVLHPLSLVAGLLDPGGVDLLIALYLVSAALGTFALARELGLDRPKAFLAGTAFALSGFGVSMTGNLVFLAGVASMPWQVAALAAVGRSARLSIPAAALATAVTLFSGDTQMAAVSALFGGAIAAERAGWRAVARVCAATVIGGLLAAVQILPTFAALDVSARSAGLQPVESNQFAFPPWRLIELLVPGVFVRLDGVPSSEVFRWLGGPFAAGNELPFCPSVYLGVPVVALAACAPLRDGRVKILAAAALVFLWLAFGHFAGARQALEWVPLWSRFRYAEKLVAPLSLSLALLAAFGANGVDGTGPDRRRFLVTTGICVALALAALGVSSIITDSPGRAAAHLASNIQHGLPHVLIGSAAMVAAGLLRRARGALLGAAVAASLLAAVPFARVLMPLQPCHAWPGALAANPPGARLILPYFTPHVDFMGPEASYADVLASIACQLATVAGPAQNVRDRVDSFWSYGGLGSHRLSTMATALPGQWARGSRHFSVTHASLVRWASSEEQESYRAATSGGRLVTADRGHTIELHAVPHLPWARFAPEVTLAAGLDEAAELFASVIPSGRDVVVVESASTIPIGQGLVRSQSRQPEHLALEVDAFSEGLLVVNDAFWPGWVARIDGREVPLLASNVIARGVVVPAGRHVVTMDYEPFELRAGFALSSLGALVLAALIAIEARPHLRIRIPPQSAPA